MKYGAKSWALWIVGALIVGYAQVIRGGVLLWAIGILLLVGGFAAARQLTSAQREIPDSSNPR